MRQAYRITLTMDTDQIQDTFGIEDKDVDTDEWMERTLSVLQKNGEVAFYNWDRADRLPNLLVYTAVTVIHPDGEDVFCNWNPDPGDLDSIRGAGIFEFTGVISEDDGMYGVGLHPLVAAKIRDSEAAGAWSITDQPPWMDMQRGEGGSWARLPSGTWLGIASCDLEV